MHNLRTFPNKLRLLTMPVNTTQAVTVMVLVGAGSRYEVKENNGISHFIEHMFFKGGKRYTSAQMVAEAIDSIGGEFNAFTGKDYAGYYVKLSHDQVETAFAVLSDMLIEAQFPENEIEKERGVILEEYNMYQDTPMYKIGWQFENQIFGDQPLGWDQIGDPQLIKTVNQKDFLEYKNQLYTPDNITIGVAGNITVQAAEVLTSKYFNMAERTKSYTHKPFSKPTNTEKLVHTVKKTEQSHLVIGTPGVAFGTPESWPAKILATVLGGNMSSRMFLNVREAHGLAYYIHTSIDSYADAGCFSTNAGVDNKRLPMAIEKILNEYEAVRTTNQVSKAELQKAKNYLKGKLSLKLEDSQAYVHMAARQELLGQEVDTIKTLRTKIDAVTIDQVHAIADQLLKPENMHISIIGPEQDRNELEALLG